jgi:hypothetical protein
MPSIVRSLFGEIFRAGVAGGAGGATGAAASTLFFACAGGGAPAGVAAGALGGGVATTPIIVRFDAGCAFAARMACATDGGGATPNIVCFGEGSLSAGALGAAAALLARPAALADSAAPSFLPPLSGCGGPGMNGEVMPSIVLSGTGRFSASPADEPAPPPPSGEGRASARERASDELAFVAGRGGASAGAESRGASGLDEPARPIIVAFGPEEAGRLPTGLGSASGVIRSTPQAPQKESLGLAGVPQLGQREGTVIDTTG